MIKKPFNILYISSFGDFWGGGQVSLFNLVKNLDTSIFKPHVCLPAKGSLANRLQEHDIDVSIVELPNIVVFKVYRNLKALYNLLMLTKKYNINLIHTDGPRNTFYAGLVGKINKLPLVWHVRAYGSDKYDRILVHLSSMLILVADSLRSRFSWIESDKKLVTIYNGVDLSEFRRKIEPFYIRRKFSINEDSLLISSIGRLEPLKGQKYLIEACGMIKEKLRDFRLLIVGEIVDSIYHQKCKEVASDFGIQNRVIFSGHLTDINQILNETDIFVLPSLSEGFSRSLIEAMGASKPVVATNVGGNSEAFIDNVSGLIVPPKNIGLLSEKIHFLAQDKNARTKMGDEARKMVEKKFSIERNVRKTEKVYLDIINKYAS